MAMIYYRNEKGEYVPFAALPGQSGPKGDDTSVPDYVKAEAARLAAVVQSRQNENTISFIACSDLHYSTIYNASKQLDAMTHMGQAMKLIREAVRIDFAAMLGDMIWDSGETAEVALEEIRFVNSCLHDGFNGIPNFRCRGNHDNGFGCGADLSNSQIFANIGCFNSGAAYDSANRVAGYCYRDFEDVKLRVICLNSSENAGYWFTSEQTAWLASVLDLSGKGGGWRSVILSHHPLDWGRDGGVNPIPIVQSASGIIGAFHGHIHNFKVGTVTGTSITRIAIPNGCNGRENEYGTAYGVDWSDTKYPKTQGSATDTAFCVVTIDLAKNQIYADHYGAGISRVIAFDGSVALSFTLTNNLSNVTSSSTVANVGEGESYSAALTAVSGYEISSVSVYMGGKDITSSAYNGGKINISSVTGAVVITATAVLKDSGGEDPGPGVYTNLVPTAVATDKTTVFNGTGYKDGTYASGAHTGDDADCVTTGFIWLPADVGAIYAKGATWDTSNGHCRINMFSDANLGNANQISFSIKANESQSNFTIEKLGENYYKFTPNIAQVKDKWYCMSFVGAGENLIITHDEPIA